MVGPGDTKSSSHRPLPTLHLKHVQVSKADPGKGGMEAPSTGDQRLPRAQTLRKQQGGDLIKGRKERAQGGGDGGGRRRRPITHGPGFPLSSLD